MIAQPGAPAAHSETAHQSGLDALRAFAALSVFGLHAIVIPAWTSFPASGPLAWFRVGFLGVDVFFVISGYVITSSLVRLMAQSPEHWRAAFLVRRAARIYPLYLVSSLLFLLIVDASALTGPDWLWQAVSHLLLLHNLLPATSGSINGVAWTIATEAQLYLLTLLLLQFLRGVAPLRIAIGAVVLAWGWRAATMLALPVVIPDAPSNTYSHVATQFPGFLDAYGLGVAAALFRGPVPIPRVWLFFAGSALMTLSAALLLPYLTSNDYWNGWLMPIGFRTLPAIAALSLLLAVRDLSFRANSPLVLLGVWSYGLYLLHLPILQLLARTQLPPPAIAAVALLLSAMLAAISWYTLERRAIAWGRRFGKRP